MTTDHQLKVWLDQTVRPVLREVLRDELADLLPALMQSTQSSIPSEELPVTTEQAAKQFGIAKQTLYQNAKKIKHTKRFGRLYFYPSDLRSYLANGRGAENE